MENLENSIVPDAVFIIKTVSRITDNKTFYNWKTKSTDDIFKNKKIVLFALPGAFTPVCSDNHLPGYEKLYKDFKKEGVDEVICLSMNDPFVMFQWAENLNIKNIFMLPDGNGEFTKKMGMLVDKSNIGFGKRSWRYSMYVENKKIIKVFVEPGLSDNADSDPLEFSDAEMMLDYIKYKNNNK